LAPPPRSPGRGAAALAVVENAAIDPMIESPRPRGVRRGFTSWSARSRRMKLHAHRRTPRSWAAAESGAATSCEW